MSITEVRDLIISLTKKVDELLKLKKQPEEEDKLLIIAAKIIKDLSQ